MIPGISAPQLLAARHRIVLHEVGQPVHVTTARRLQEAVAAGQTNLVVMLIRARSTSTGLDDWWIWWGANLGAPPEELVAGPGRRRAAAAIERARAAAAAAVQARRLGRWTSLPRCEAAAR